jgi:anti-sigma-K factor RskA
MNCPTKRNEDAEIPLDYCAQTLSPEQTAEFEIHLKQCADCSRLVEAQREVWGSLEAWTPHPVSTNFDARLYARIAKEQSAPAWQLWLRRIFHPPVPYPLWKSAVPLVAACAVLAAGLAVRMPDAKDAVTHQVRAEKVDIEQVEQTLEDFDILTPAVQSPTGSM